MKLHPKYPVVFEDSGEFAAVHTESRSFRAAGRRRIRVRKIKVRRGRNSLEQAGGAHRAELVPAHVRQLDVLRELLDTARQDGQAGHFGGFRAALIERTQSETNSKEWHATRQSREQRLGGGAG